jgi:hypothetical protein
LERDVPEETPIVIPFGNLLNACRKHGMKARLYIFDGGETVEVTDAEGKQLLRTTAMWGDRPSASEQAALSLMKQDLIWVGDFEG